MAPLWLDTDPDTEAEMIRRLREASVTERFAIADALTFSTIALSRRALFRLDPEASEREVLLRWVGLHYGRPLERELRDYFHRRETS